MGAGPPFSFPAVGQAVTDMEESDPTKGQPGMIDFIQGPVDVNPICNTSQVTNTNIDMLINGLKSAVNDNYICLGLAFLIVAITVAVVAYIATAVWDLVMSWRRGVASSFIRQNKEMFKPYKFADDVRYKPRRGVLPRSKTEGVAESVLVAKRIQSLTGRYSAYNDAIKRHAVVARDPEAAKDIIDGRILARESDDYVYDDPRKNRPRMQLDDGALNDRVGPGGGNQHDHRFEIAEKGR